MGRAVRPPWPRTVAGSGHGACAGLVWGARWLVPVQDMRDAYFRSVQPSTGDPSHNEMLYKCSHGSTWYDESQFVTPEIPLSKQASALTVVLLLPALLLPPPWWRRAAWCRMVLLLVFCMGMAPQWCASLCQFGAVKDASLPQASHAYMYVCMQELLACSYSSTYTGISAMEKIYGKEYVWKATGAKFHATWPKQYDW